MGLGFLVNECVRYGHVELLRYAVEVLKCPSSIVRVLAAAQDFPSVQSIAMFSYVFDMKKESYSIPRYGAVSNFEQDWFKALALYLSSLHELELPGILCDNAWNELISPPTRPPNAPWKLPNPVWPGSYSFVENNIVLVGHLIVSNATHLFQFLAVNQNTALTPLLHPWFELLKNTDLTRVTLMNGNLSLYYFLTRHFGEAVSGSDQLTQMISYIGKEDGLLAVDTSFFVDSSRHVQLEILRESFENRLKFPEWFAKIDFENNIGNFERADDVDSLRYLLKQKNLLGWEEEFFVSLLKSLAESIFNRASLSLAEPLWDFLSKIPENELIEIITVELGDVNSVYSSEKTELIVYLLKIGSPKLQRAVCTLIEIESVRADLYFISSKSSEFVSVLLQRHLNLDPMMIERLFVNEINEGHRFSKTEVDAVTLYLNSGKFSFDVDRISSHIHAFEPPGRAGFSFPPYVFAESPLDCLQFFWEKFGKRLFCTQFFQFRSFKVFLDFIENVDQRTYHGLSLERCLKVLAFIMVKSEVKMTQEFYERISQIQRGYLRTALIQFIAELNLQY
jgi:hypothetical protein